MESIIEWIEKNPEVNSFNVGICDLNGIWRGKRVPVRKALEIISEGTRMPLSASCIDIWGEDLADSGYLFKSGDSDGIAVYTGRGIVRTSEKHRPVGLLPLWLQKENGDFSEIDARHILNQACEKFYSLGLSPILAFELEFYLLDAKAKSSSTSTLGNQSGIEKSASVYSIDDIEKYEFIFSEIYQACEQHNIPADTAISENAVGQFEINLLHSDDPVKAADDVVFFKRLVKSIAKKYALRASFMAKPILNRAGSGMHVHFSILDKIGKNIFDDNTDSGSKKLHFAVGGLIEAMQDSCLIFAPHLNSYRRLLKGSHAPAAISWGYENRTASIRIPGGKFEERRIEHRLAGADANPYLVAASILEAALHGLSNKIEPPSPVRGNSYTENLPALPKDWGSAIAVFEKSEIGKTLYSKEFVKTFSKYKYQELGSFSSRLEDFEFLTYVEAI